MSTPDEAAATPLGLSILGNMVQAIALDNEHIGDLIEVDGHTGMLLTLPRRVTNPGQDDLVLLTIQQPGQTLATTVNTAPDAVVTLHQDDTPEPDDIPTTVDPMKVRELAEVEDSLRVAEGEVKDLKARRDQLSGELMETFELLGIDDFTIDGRKVYLRQDTYPAYRQKDDGTKYTAADAVEVLQAIGRGAQVSPVTVNYQTMGSILREYRDSEDEVIPPELDEIVHLESKFSVRVGPPRKKRRKR